MAFTLTTVLKKDKIISAFCELHIELYSYLKLVFYHLGAVLLDTSSTHHIGR